MNPLLEALQWFGETLDKPGASVRGLLAGKPEQAMNLVPFSDTLGFTDPSQRISGRDILESWGVLGPNTEGFDAGDVAGFGVDLVTDPLNWIGAGLAARTAKIAGAARESNALRRALLASGGMPEEIATLTKAVDETGKPMRMYHGTSEVFDAYDVAKTQKGVSHGPGVYLTYDPNVAAHYASNNSFDRSWVVPQEKQRAYYDFMRSPEAEALFNENRWNSDVPLAGMSDEDLMREGLELHIGGKGGGIDLGRRGEEALRQFFQYVPKPQNIRMNYMDIRNPFHHGNPVAVKDLETILGKLPGGQDVPFSRANDVMSGDEAWNILEKATKGDTFPINQAIRDSGYDAIQWTANRAQGHPTYMKDLTVVFDPKNVYSPWVAPMERRVPRLSPLLAALAGHNVVAEAVR